MSEIYKTLMSTFEKGLTRTLSSNFFLNMLHKMQHVLMTLLTFQSPFHKILLQETLLLIDCNDQCTRLRDYFEEELISWLRNRSQKMKKQVRKIFKNAQTRTASNRNS